MRLDRLSLVRYGHFDDHAIDFGAAAGDGDDTHGGIDLHVVYGDNEAGKSTCYHALLDLLFGIKARQPPYAFRYARNELRIDACLSAAGQSLDLTRTGAGLLDPHGARLDELALLPWLNGLERESYSAMFSMDEQSLEQGGQDILASKGDLGRLLFAAGSGLGNLDGRLDSLLADGAGYYRQGKRAQWPLTQHLNGLKAIDAELEALDVRADDWRRLKKRAADEQRAFDAAQDADAEARRHQSRLQRASDWRSRALTLLAKQQRFDGAGPLPLLPAHWWQTLDTFMPQARKACRERDELASRLAELDARLANPAPNQALLDTGPAIDALRDGALQADAETSRLSARRAERDQAHESARDAAARLGIQSAPGSLDDPLLHGEARERCRTLLQRHAGLIETQRAAQRERQAAEQELARLQAPARLSAQPSARPSAQPSAPSSDAPRVQLADASIDALERAVSSVEADDAARPLGELHRQADECHDEIGRAMLALAPWRGDTGALAALQPPAAAAQASLARALAQATAAQGDCRSARDRGAAECERDAAALGELAEVAHDDQWGTLLQQQWSRWREHRDALAAAAPAERVRGTADRFEHTLRRIDRLTGERDAALETRLARRNAERRLAQTQQEQQQREAELLRAGKALREVERQVDELCQGLALPAGTGLEVLQAWLAHRDTVLALAQSLASTERRITARQAHRHAEAQRLVALLVNSGVEPDADPAAPLEQRLAQARDRLDALRDRQRLDDAQRTERAKAHAGLTMRREAEAAAEQALQQWCDDWQSATHASALAEQPIEAATARLMHLEQLAEASRIVREHDQAEQRLQAGTLERARRIDELAQTFGAADASAPGPQAGDPLLALTHLLEAARAQQRQRLQDRDDRDTVSQAAARLRGEHQALFDDLQARYRLLEVDSLDALQRCTLACRDQQTGRETLQSERHALLSEAGAGLADTPSLDALAALDPHALAADLAQASSALDAASAERDRCLLALRSTRSALDAIGADDAVALLQERRSALLLTIGESVREALSLRLGVAAAREGIRRWRGLHRSDMLDDASDTFAGITGARFGGLQAEPAGDGEECLYATAADGSQKLADQLSKGTRFQLYLALRVAAYRRWCRQHPPPPFIADDVLETFDDERTALTFEAFADMARHGQVIYLTHHRHVVDIARAATGGAVHVHELPVRPVIVPGPVA